MLYSSDYGFSDRLSQTLARGVTKAGVATEMVDLLSADPQEVRCVSGGEGQQRRRACCIGQWCHQGRRALKLMWPLGWWTCCQRTPRRYAVTCCLPDISGRGGSKEGVPAALASNAAQRWCGR